MKTNKNVNYIFLNYNNILRKCMHKSQRIMNLNSIQNSNNKSKATCWGAISSSLSNNLYKNDIESINYDNMTYQNPSDICNIFNNYFNNGVDLRLLTKADITRVGI